MNSSVNNYGRVAELRSRSTQDTRFPEGDGESEAQDKLDEIRMRDESDNPFASPASAITFRRRLPVANLSLSIIIAVSIFDCANTPASIMPTILAQDRSLGSPPAQLTAATARGVPSINRVRNAAPLREGAEPPRPGRAADLAADRRRGGRPSQRVDPEDALITRPARTWRFGPSAGGAAFLTRLIEGTPLAVAASAALEVTQASILRHIVGMIDAGVFATIKDGDPR